MKNLLITILLSILATASWGNDKDYTSMTFKRSVWSSSSYVGDLSDWVYFGNGYATVAEYRAPKSSFSLTAAVRQKEDGDSELEALVGSFRLKDGYIKLETGGATGRVYNPDPLEALILPNERNFKSSLNILTFGWDGTTPGVKYGAGMIQLVQPAEINLTFYALSPGVSSNGSLKWAKSAVDTEFQSYLIGGWFELDSLGEFMRGRETPLSNITVDGPATYGLALDIESIYGIYIVEEGIDMASLMNSAYGMNYRFVESQGLGWYLSYKLAYNYAYRIMSEYSVGLQVGIEGRVFQPLFELPYSEQVSSKNEVIGNMGIGDNTSLQWGPYFRFAWEF